MKRLMLLAMCLTILCCDVSPNLDQENFRTAVRDGDIRSVRMLLKKHVDVNGLDDANRTAIFDAAANDHPEVVRLLLNNGAKTDLKDVRGLTPLQSTQDPDIKKMLSGRRTGQNQ